MGGCDRGGDVDEPTGTPGGDATVRLTEVKAEAVLARDRAAEAARRARELAAGAPPDPHGAEQRSTRARTSLIASLRSAAEAHRRAARTHLGAADLGSGDLQGHRTEARLHLDRADEDDARAAELEGQGTASGLGVSD